MGATFEFSSASSSGGSLELAGGGVVRNLLPDEDCPTEEATFSSYDPCLMDGERVPPVTEGSPILLRREMTSSDSLAPLPNLTDLPARTGQSLEIDDSSRDDMCSPFTIDASPVRRQTPDLPSDSEPAKISPSSQSTSQGSFELLAQGEAPPSESESASSQLDNHESLKLAISNPGPVTPRSLLNSQPESPHSVSSILSDSPRKKTPGEMTPRSSLSIQSKSSQPPSNNCYMRQSSSSSVSDEPVRPSLVAPPPLEIPAASNSFSTDSAPLALLPGEFEQQELVAYDHTDVEIPSIETSDVSSMEPAPTPPPTKVVMINEDNNVSHQLTEVPPVSVIRTSREGEVVCVNWIRGNMQIKNITVPLRRCRVRSAAQLNETRYVVIEVNSCGAWCVTLLPDSPAIFNALCAQLRRAPEFNNAMERPPERMNRVIKRRYGGPGNLELFLSPSIKDEVLSILNLSLGTTWWSRLLHCCDTQSRGLLIQRNTLTPSEGGWLASLPPSKKPASLEWVDEPVALRSVLLVVPFGEGSELTKEGEAQAVITASILGKLTGNSYSLEGAGTCPAYAKHAVRLVEGLNKYRSSTVRPVRVVIPKRTFDPITENTDWDESNAAIDAALRGQGPVSLHLSLLPPKQKTSSPFLVSAGTMASPDRMGSADAAKNPASLVGDSRVQSSQYIPLYRFPYWKPDGFSKVLGVSLGHARATTPLIERGTSHQILVLPETNIRVLLNSHSMGSNASRFHLRDGAIVPYLLGPKGVPYFVVGDAGATLVEAADTLTFTADRVVKNRSATSHSPLNLVRADSPRGALPPHSGSKRQIILLRAGQNCMNDMGEDLGLSALGRRQLIAMAAWLGQCFNDIDGVLGQPTRWCVAGISDSHDDNALQGPLSLVESLDLFKEVFYQYLPVSMIEKNEPASNELMPEALMRVSDDQCVCIMFSDERMALRYLADCMNVDTTNMRWPHAGFLPITVEGGEGTCPTFGTISHLPPSLVC